MINRTEYFTAAIKEAKALNMRCLFAAVDETTFELRGGSSIYTDAMLAGMTPAAFGKKVVDDMVKATPKTKPVFESHVETRIRRKKANQKVKNKDSAPDQSQDDDGDVVLEVDRKTKEDTKPASELLRSMINATGS